MELESAINTAIEFETQVFENYQRAQAQAADPKGRRIFEVLSREEQGHIDYLRQRLSEWRSSGRLTAARLETAIPSRQRISESLERLRSTMKGEPSAGTTLELDLLRRALQAEQETSAFYQRLVRELPSEGAELFARFLEIEEGHLAIVQAEIDAVTGLGFWFDLQEFSLEAE